MALISLSGVAYPLPARKRIDGAVAEAVTADVAHWYACGHDVRDIARYTGRSYGYIHRLLHDSGVQLRRRGQPTGYRRPTPSGER